MSMGQCQGIAHAQSHVARVTSKNKTVGKMDLDISQLFRFYSILSVQIKCYGIRGSEKPGKLSGITVYAICRCFLLCHILARETYTAFACSISGFAFVKQHAPQKQLKNEAVVLVRRATGFVQARNHCGTRNRPSPALTNM